MRFSSLKEKFFSKGVAQATVYTEKADLREVPAMDFWKRAALAGLVTVVSIGVMTSLAKAGSSSDAELQRMIERVQRDARSQVQIRPDYDGRIEIHGRDVVGNPFHEMVYDQNDGSVRGADRPAWRDPDAARSGGVSATLGYVIPPGEGGIAHVHDTLARFQRAFGTGNRELTPDSVVKQFSSRDPEMRTSLHLLRQMGNFDDVRDLARALRQADQYEANPARAPHGIDWRAERHRLEDQLAMSVYRAIKIVDAVQRAQQIRKMGLLDDVRVSVRANSSRGAVQMGRSALFGQQVEAVGPSAVDVAVAREILRDPQFRSYDVRELPTGFFTPGNALTPALQNALEQVRQEHLRAFPVTPTKGMVRSDALDPGMPDAASNVSKADGTTIHYGADGKMLALVDPTGTVRAGAPAVPAPDASPTPPSLRA